MSDGAPRWRVAVIGAGPIGLEAALYAATLGHDVTVFEAGEVGEHVGRWGHVRMFSPWSMNVSPLGRAVLEAAGWEPPDPDACPTGEELRRRYLRPLAAAVAERAGLRTRCRVLAIGRQRYFKGDAIGDPRRGDVPFGILASEGGREALHEADRVIDAGGVYGQHNWLGDGGIPAPGERAAASRISYWLEDYEGADRRRFAGRAILVVGAGHSAATAVCSLSRIVDDEPETRVWWLTRSSSPAPVPVVADDPLAERDRLSRRANRLADDPASPIVRVAGRSVIALETAAAGVVVHTRGLDTEAPAATRDAGSPEPLRVDHVVALVGYRPDLEIGRELQAHACWASEGTMKLAATLLAEGDGDCLAQTNPGPEALAMPEPGYLWLGHKAYGRNPAFLLRLGHQQIRDAFRLWHGDPTLDLF